MDSTKDKRTMEVIHLYALPPNGWRQELMMMRIASAATADDDVGRVISCSHVFPLHNV